jgi:hypothetical protein
MNVKGNTGMEPAFHRNFGANRGMLLHANRGDTSF